MLQTSTASSSKIPTFETVCPVSGKDDACFAELAAVLAKHDATNRFGVFLLHEHFPLSDGEVLVESVDAQSRTMVTKPMRIEGLQGTVLETMWQFSADKPKETPPLPDVKPEKIIDVPPTRVCVQTCVWDDGPNGRHHHTRHKPGF